MNKETRNSIKKMVQTVRGILTQEAREQLEGVYGLHSNGTFENVSSLPELRDTHEAETRQQLEYFLSEEAKTDLKGKNAVDKLVKEIAFTHLNRFVAFKMMETRKIIRETISRGADSNAFKFYLVDHSDDERLFNSGRVDEAYEHFILWQCSQIEIRVLFDPYILPSRIFPHPRTLKEVLDIINGEEIASVWQEDETIGWVYQYFNDEDKEAVFDKIYKQKKKMELRDIPAATQIFTPKWIVKYLVENTLGRLWLRMHPDSQLREHMQYYVPNEQDKDRIELKRVIDITLLDPACGTMHFGMTAFDIFYQMYLEEIENAGKEGWGQEPSVKKEADISKSIIENNLYGIDLDLRAIQLSALSLYIKAKGKNKDILLKKFNLTYTDIPPFSDEAIKNFVDNLQTVQAITKKLLREILPVLNKAYYLGSLLKIETIINDFVEKEKIVPKGFLINQPSLFKDIDSNYQMEFDLYISKRIAWDEVKSEIISAFQQFTETHKEASGAFVASESIRGMGLIDALIRKHDVVVANPPFSGRRNWNSELGEDLKKLYPDTSNDLYSTFIDRCIELTNHNGYVGLINIHSFMFTSSYEALRTSILEKTSIETMVHLGPTFMELSNPYAQQCTMYVLRNIQPNAQLTGVYLRMVKYINEEKELMFSNALNDYRNNPNSFSDPHVFVLQQEKLKAIPGFPFVYWVSDGIRELFINKTVSEYAQQRQGLGTCDNFRFLRYWHEVSNKNIGFNSTSRENARDLKKTWYPYMKGGAVNRWYGNQEYVVNWANDGIEIKEFLKTKNPNIARSEAYYFLEGITYSFLTISNLSLRFMPKGFVFDVAGSCFFPITIDNFILLGLLNSKVVTFLIKLINPTVSYQIGDIARIPVPDKLIGTELKNTPLEKVQKCINLKKQELKYQEASWDIIAPSDWQTGIYKLLQIQKELVSIESEISESMYNFYELDNKDIDQIESEFNALPAKLPNATNLNDLPLHVIKRFYLEKHVPDEVLKQCSQSTDEEEDTASKEGSEDDSSRGRGRQKRFLTFEELCLASGFHPETVYNYIVANKLERAEERFELAVSWISYAVGIVLGRFKPGKKGELGCGINENGSVLLQCDFEKLNKLVDDDGIMELDKGHPDDLPARVEKALAIMLGDADGRSVINTIGGDLHSFLERDFFIKWHIPQYKKRPVYWLLQSAKKSYGIYIFHERLKADSIYSIQEKYINSKIVLERSHLAERRSRLATLPEGKEKRNLEKEIDKLESLIDELIDFQTKIKAIADRGYDPDINDGVILNMTPLHEIIPWTEPKKYWKELQEGKYDWAHIAMKYWADRVKDKCKKDKSLAFAHGLEN